MNEYRVLVENHAGDVLELWEVDAESIAAALREALERAECGSRNHGSAWEVR